jgi:transcriptional adapter 2-alpha
MPLNISHAEGVDMLSEKEREICSILRLYPRLYITIKDTLIKESLRLGGLKRAQARASVKIDVNKTSKLYDFFITAGWIKPPASGE